MRRWVGRGRGLQESDQIMEVHSLPKGVIKLYLWVYERTFMNFWTTWCPKVTLYSGRENLFCCIKLKSSYV